MKIQRICPLMYSLVLLVLFAACQTVGPSQSQIINTPTDKIEITPIKPATDTSQPIVTPTDTPSPTATPTIPPPSINGHVTAAGSGDPLVEARVELRTGQNLDELVAYTSTDQDGYYRFDDLPEGVYYALAFADGYARELYQQETALQEANVLNYDGKPLAGIDFVLNEGGSISGTLTVGGEQPAANVVVSAVEVKYAWADAFMYRAVSDENGFYQISYLPLGEYVVVIEEPGYATEFYDSTFVVDGIYVRLGDIKYVKTVHTEGFLSPSTGPKLIIAGIALFLFDQLNHTVIQGNDFRVPQGIAITSGALIVTGAVWTSLKYHKFRPGENRRIRIFRL